jgi:hypothetical protein
MILPLLRPVTSAILRAVQMLTRVGLLRSLEAQNPAPYRVFLHESGGYGVPPCVENLRTMTSGSTKGSFFLWFYFPPSCFVRATSLTPVGTEMAANKFTTPPEAFDLLLACLSWCLFPRGKPWRLTLMPYLWLGSFQSHGQECNG